MNAEDLGRTPNAIVEEVLETAVKLAVKRVSFRGEAKESAAEPAALNAEDTPIDVGGRVQLPPITSQAKVNKDGYESPRVNKPTENGSNSVKLSPLHATDQPPVSDSATASRDETIRSLSGKLAAMEMRLEALEASSRPVTAGAPQPQETSSRPVTAEAPQPQPEPQPEPKAAPEQTQQRPEASEPMPAPETAAQVFAEMIKTDAPLEGSQTSPDKMANNLGPGGTELSPTELVALLQQEHQRVVAENQKLYGMVRGQATVSTTSAEADAQIDAAAEVEPRDAAQMGTEDDVDNEIQFYNDKQHVAGPSSPEKGSPGGTGSRARARTRSRGGARSSGDSPDRRPNTAGGRLSPNLVIITRSKATDVAYQKQSLKREKDWVGNFGAVTKVLRRVSSLSSNSYRDDGIKPVRQRSPLGARNNGPVLYLAGMAATGKMAKELLDDYKNKPKTPNRPEFDLSSPSVPPRGNKVPSRPRTVSDAAVGVGQRGKSKFTSNLMQSKSKSTNNSPMKVSRKLFPDDDGDGGDVCRHGNEGSELHSSSLPTLVHKATPVTVNDNGSGNREKNTLSRSNSTSSTSQHSGNSPPSPSHRKNDSPSSLPVHHKGIYSHDVADEETIVDHLVHHAYFDDSEKVNVDHEKLEQLAHKLKLDSKANDYIHLHHADVEDDHDKIDSLKMLHNDLSVAHRQNVLTAGETVMGAKQRRHYIETNAKLAVHRGRMLVSTCKEFRERPITKVESNLFRR